MTALFSENFSTVQYVHHNDAHEIKREDILNTKPKFVVEEIIERRLNVYFYLPTLDTWMQEENAAAKISTSAQENE